MPKFERPNNSNEPLFKKINGDTFFGTDLNKFVKIWENESWFKYIWWYG